MSYQEHNRYLSAVADFRRARSQADLKELLARISGSSTQLLSFEEVRKMLRVHGGTPRGLKDIPLDAIAGSVGRYTDFTRDFLPRRDTDRERWARVKAAATGMVGLPPIEVYQIGEAYFVKDGNHRVSVARQLGATHIQAYVTEIQSRVPISADISPSELILKAEYASFLEETQLDKLRPGADLNVTVPGQYQELLEHIQVHRYLMGIDLKRPISYPEAVTHWYDQVYLPIIKIIREQGILRDFPNRTEADLYLWIAEHRAQLEEELGWQIRPEKVASDLVNRFSTRARRSLIKIGRQLKDWLIPDILEAGPPPGEWRSEVLSSSATDHLFNEILVPVNGKEQGWSALEQALLIAQQESGILYGLYVVRWPEQRKGKKALSIQERFNQRCQDAGVPGRLTIAWGDISREISLRAVWADLVVINLNYPPPENPFARLGSGLRDLIQRCPRPILAIPQTIAPLDRLLLAYDGSPKAEEALFVATYLAGSRHAELTVVTVNEERATSQEILKQAQNYLEPRGIQARYIIKDEPVPEAILEASNQYHSDLLIMGGYRHSPVLEVVLDSTVNKMLRESCKPLLICR